MNVDFESLKLLPQMFALIEKLNNQLEEGHTKRWLSVKELANYLSYSSDRIYKIKEEQLIEGIHFFKKSGKILFDRVAIDSWVVKKDTHETYNAQRQIVDNVLSSVKQIRTLNLDDTKANRKQALEKIIPEITYKLNSGKFFENEMKNKVPTVDEYAKISFELHSKSRKISTKYDYEASLRLHISPTFGKKSLDKIKPSDIQLWQNKLLDKFKPRRVRNIRATFSTIFDDALRDEIIVSNPISKIKTPKIKKIESKSFLLEEVKLIIETAKNDLKAFVALGFFTGLRSGEIIGLKWENVDFYKKEIHINRAIRMGVVSTPKTKSSIRTIDILDNLMPYLQEQYELTSENNSYVFLNGKDNHYFDIKAIRDSKWKHLLKECDIEHRTIYQMRHTFATMMIENGEDILRVSNMLGHKDSSMTLQMYAKYRKRENVKRASFLDNI